MGSSFVEFHNKGFWTRDAKIEVWLHLLVCEIDSISHPPLWLLQLRDHWHDQSTVGFVGCISASLDQHVTTNEHLNVVLCLSERALNRLDTYGKLISRDDLNDMKTGGEGSFFVSAVCTEEFKRVGRAFVSLLRGELNTDAATSPMI